MSKVSSNDSSPALDVVFLSAHDTRGGTVNYIKALRGRFEGDGYRCASMAFYSGADPDPTGVEEVLTPRTTLPLQAYLGVIATFVATMRRRRPAAILSVMPMASIAAGVAGWFSGAAIVATHHSPYDRNGTVPRLLDKIVGSLGAYRQIICVSAAVADSFAGHPAAYRRRISVVSNGIKPTVVQSGRGAILAKFGLPDDMKIAYMAGRLAHQKNVLKAVEAAAMIEGVRLVISGDGPLYGDIVALAERLGIPDRLHLIGHIDRQDMIDLMAICDVFVQVSLYEGQSLSLLEAVSVGAPPVVSNIPVQLEVIRLADGREAGLTCDPIDANDIARAIRSLLFDPAQRAAVLATLAVLTPRVRTEDQMLDDYDRVLRSAIERKRPTIGASHAF